MFEKIKSILNFTIINFKDGKLTIGTIILLVIAFMITHYVLQGIRHLITKKLPNRDKIKFISIFKFVKYFIYVLVIVFILNASGVNVSVLLTASAALFIGLGFALQQLFQDVIAGVMIILDQSLHVGDVIEIENRVGKVAEINLRTTRVITRNERVLVVPNHKFMNETIFNWTQNNHVVREDIKIGVAYGSDIDLVRALLMEIASKDPRVEKKPKPQVLFENFGESSLDFTLYIFVTDSFTVPSLKSDLRFEIDKKFKIHNIKIPFPQREIHVNNHR